MAAGLKYEFLNPLSTDGCLLPAQVADLTRTVTDGLHDFFPNVVVADQCGPHSLTGNTHVFAAWPNANDSSSARADELRAIRLLKPQEQFHAWVGFDFLRSAARAAFAKKPHRYTRVGDKLVVPDPAGTIVLTGLDLALKAGSGGAVVIETLIDGYVLAGDVGPFSFRIQVDETLGIKSSIVDGKEVFWPAITDSKTTTHRADWDVILAIIASLSSLGALIPTLWQLGAGGGDVGGGAGGAALSFFPTSVPLAGGQNLLFNYASVTGASLLSTTTSPAGLSFGASLSTVTRKPAVKIGGSAKLVTIPGATAQGTYYAVVSDMRAPISFRWSSSAVLDAPNDHVVTLHIPIAGLKAGQSTRTTLTLTASDADAATLGPVTSTLDIEVDVVAPDAPHRLPKVGFGGTV